MGPHPLKAGISEAVARNDMIARRELPHNPAIEPRQKSETERLGMIGRQRACGHVCEEADLRIEPGQFKGTPGSSTPRTKRFEAQKTVFGKGARIIVTIPPCRCGNHEASRLNHD